MKKRALIPEQVWDHIVGGCATCGCGKKKSNVAVKEEDSYGDSALQTLQKEKRGF